MASRNSRSSRPAARSSRVPQSARAVRSTKAAQSGRIGPRHEAERFSRSSYGSGGSKAHPSTFQAAYTPGSQGRNAQGAYARKGATGQYAWNNPQYSRAASRGRGRGKKIALGVLAAVVVAVIGCGTAFALYINSIDKELIGNKTQEEMQALQDVLAPRTNFDEPFYIMLIGSDRRTDDDSMGARSDTNIVVRVDPTQSLVTLVSIPRDTKIDIDGYGTNKFNAAYNYGGAAATIEEANQLCGVEISHYAEVNFDELVQLVDVVGGVDVDVEERIDDPDAGNIVIEAGLQHLDGEAALVFARSRAYVDGDFTRTSNQRKLIGALVDKVLSLPVTELPGIIQSAAKCVTTDLSVTDIVALAQQFKDAGDITMYSAMVPSVTGYVGDVSYVFTDETALKEMMQIVEEGGDPSSVTASSDAYAQNSSGSGSSSSSSSSSGYYSGGGGTYSGGGTGYDSGYGSTSGNDASYGSDAYYDETGPPTGTDTGTEVDAGDYDAGSPEESTGYDAASGYGAAA